MNELKLNFEVGLKETAIFGTVIGLGCGIGLFAVYHIKDITTKMVSKIRESKIKKRNKKKNNTEKES